VVLEWHENGSPARLVASDLRVEEGPELAREVNGLLGYPAA
jgi:hypothetical protein